MEVSDLLYCKKWTKNVGSGITRWLEHYYIEIYLSKYYEIEIIKIICGKICILVNPYLNHSKKKSRHQTNGLCLKMTI